MVQMVIHSDMRSGFYNFFNWVGGFFSSEKNTSSKRLVGISGAFTLYHTLIKNCDNEILIWAVLIMSLTALGLTTVEAITDLIKGKKNANK